MRRFLFFFLLAASVLAAEVSVAAGVVFRYLPGRPELSSPVVADGVETGPFLGPRELPARGPGGWGLAPPHSAEFDAPSSTLRSTAGDDLAQPLGLKLTVEAWVRPSTVAGRVVLLTSRVDAADGFTLGSADGIPFFEVVVGGQVHTLEGTTSLAAGEDHWLAATADYRSGVLYLSFHVDGRAAGTAAFTIAGDGPRGIAQPFFVGATAEGDPDDPALTGRFTGHLFAAVVRDYVAAEAYLTSSVPMDGGAYFGLPAFHDYPLTSFHLPMDQRIEASPTEPRYRYFLPFVNDGYIPQGTATAYEVTEDDTTALVYVAYYHMTRSGQTGTLASVVSEVDAVTGVLRRAFRLTGRLSHSHAGGIAYDRGALYVSSVGVLERYPLPDYEGPGGPKYYDLEADAAGTINVESKASFVSAFRDTLWVGDWRTASDVAPYLYAYPLGADGRPSRTARPAVYALPRNIQGVDLFEHDGVTYVFLSRNRNSREAEILRFRRSALDPYAVPEADTSIVLPVGIEDLSFFPDGTLWTNSESGTDYYQRREFDAWSVFYPFVYAVPPHVLFPGVSPTGREERPGGFDLGLTTYPNPFRGSTTVVFTLPEAAPVRVTVVDLLGRTVATLADSSVIAPGRHELRWDASTRPAGLYFVTVESGGRRKVRPITVTR